MKRTYLKYTRPVPVAIEIEMPSGIFNGTPTYAEILDWLLERDMWLEARFFGINDENYEFKDMRDELGNHRICCGGDATALDYVIIEAIRFVEQKCR